MYRPDYDQIVAAIKEKRGGRTWREISDESGVDAGLLHKFASGNRKPNHKTYLTLCAWLGVEPDHFYLKDEAA